MAKLIQSLEGVDSVSVGDRLGIHHTFRVEGEGDLREDIGALAMTQGWALRELTWKRPTLEQIFTRLVIGDVAGEPVDAGSAAKTAAPAAPAPVSSGLQLSGTDSAPAAAPAASVPLPLGTPGTAQSKTIYSLNPFDRGASRDLSKPVTVDPEPSGPGDVDGPARPDGGGA